MSYCVLHFHCLRRCYLTMLTEAIQRFAETKILGIPLFLLSALKFSQDHKIKESNLNSYDEVPGDNFPYAVMSGHRTDCN